MKLREFLANVVLIVTATTLFYAAMTDLREFKIRNELVIAIACLYGIYAFVIRTVGECALECCARIVHVCRHDVFYAQNWLGGGDVKILTVAFLWTGVRYALPFALLLMILRFHPHVLAERFDWVKVRRSERARTNTVRAVGRGALLSGYSCSDGAGF